MGFLSKKERSPEEQSEYYEKLTVESEILTKEREKAEKEAAIKELKRQHGPNWMHILGLSKLTDLSTLRSFLKGAKRGMEGMTAKSRASSAGIGKTPASRALDPANLKGIKKA